MSVFKSANTAEFKYAAFYSLIRALAQKDTTDLPAIHPLTPVYVTSDAVSVRSTSCVNASLCVRVHDSLLSAALGSVSSYLSQRRWRLVPRSASSPPC